MRQFVTFFKNTLIEISKSLCRRINGALFPIALPLMALHYHTAVAPSSSYTFLLALPRLWEYLHSLASVSPELAQLCLTSPGYWARRCGRFAACACDGPHSCCPASCEDRQHRSCWALLPTSPSHSSEICPLPRHKFHKAFRKLVSSICLPSCQTGLSNWWIGRAIAQGTAPEETGVRKPTKLSKEKRQLGLQHSWFSFGLL